MVCVSVQLALRQDSDLVMLFGLNQEAPTDEFTSDTEKPAAQCRNLEPEDNWCCDYGGWQTDAANAHPHTGWD